MASFFEDLRKNIQEGLSGITKTSESVMQRTGDILESQKARVQKASLENDLIDIYAEIGKLYTEKAVDGEVPEEYTELFAKLSDCKGAIAEIENKIAALRGVKICPDCGAEVQKEALFCPHCGAKLPEPAPEPAPEPEEAADAEFEEVKEEAAEAAEEVKEAAEEAAEDVTEAVEEVKEAAEDVAEEVKEAAEEVAEEVKEAAEDAAE